MPSFLKSYLSPLRISSCWNCHLEAGFQNAFPQSQITLKKGHLCLLELLEPSLVSPLVSESHKGLPLLGCSLMLGAPSLTARVPRSPRGMFANWPVTSLAEPQGSEAAEASRAGAFSVCVCVCERERDMVVVMVTVVVTVMVTVPLALADALSP